MGWFWGNDEGNTSKVFTNTTLTNKVMIGHTVDVSSEELLWLLTIIAIIKVIELLLHLYRTLTRNMKKKYINRNEPESKL